MRVRVEAIDTAYTWWRPGKMFWVASQSPHYVCMISDMGGFIDLCSSIVSHCSVFVIYLPSGRKFLKFCILKAKFFKLCSLGIIFYKCPIWNSSLVATDIEVWEIRLNRAPSISVLRASGFAHYKGLPEHAPFGYLFQGASLQHAPFHRELRSLSRELR